MRLSNLQAMMLYQTLRDSIVVADKANIFTFNREQRKELAESILNQQNRDYVELDVDDLVPLHTTDEGKVPPSKGTE
jgi:hypothetical protein